MTQVKSVSIREPNTLVYSSVTSKRAAHVFEVSKVKPQWVVEHWSNNQYKGLSIFNTLEKACNAARVWQSQK